MRLDGQKSKIVINVVNLYKTVYLVSRTRKQAYISSNTVYLRKTHAATWPDPVWSRRERLIDWYISSTGSLRRQVIEIERGSERLLKGGAASSISLIREVRAHTYIIFELGVVIGWIIYVVVCDGPRNSAPDVPLSKGAIGNRPRRRTVYTAGIRSNANYQIWQGYGRAITLWLWDRRASRLQSDTICSAHTGQIN